MNQRALSSDSKSNRHSLRVLILFGPLFLFAGGLLLWQLVLQPLQLLWRSQAWVATECTITESAAERERFSKNSAFRPKLSYRYQVNGVEHNATRYDFFEASGGWKWAEGVANAYPVGSRHTCYYDPASPQEAVLRREMTAAGFWVRPLVAAIFMAAGAFMFRAGLASRPAMSRESAPTAEASLAEPAPALSTTGPIVRQLSTNPSASGDPARLGSRSPSELTAEPSPYAARADWQRFAGPQQLAPTVTRTAAVIGTLLAALFWNGLLSFFIWGIIDDKAWFMLLFLTPFILIGLVLIGAFFYCLLSLFNPRVKIALSEGAPETGETIDVAWEVNGQVTRIREFSIVAVGEEQATYTRGTNTVTDKHPFQALEVCRLVNPEEIRFGTATVQIPLETMHTHSGNRNKIVWSLKVQGKIPLFPDVNEQYEFRVLPRGAR